MTVWFICVLGATLIVNRSVLFAGLRRLFPKPEGETPFFGTLIRCTQCLGFWVGLFASPLAPSPLLSSPDYPYAFAVCSAFALASAVSGLGFVLTYFMIHRLGMDPNTEE